ncbi:DUF4360 domain-containing protein [Chondromyces apiculatus]|uniref:Putative secreted protein n=1 Tax=Chondromyces apiculatus DSM 436 TaxID=1192034 RepID=A0A017TIV5_9BACT|nr:DUF4360 domain-containing protein [Chondromyces apiculatus]EYF08832.1 putative secreted protein [Chondromyces apiculatus DSM 436]
MNTALARFTLVAALAGVTLSGGASAAGSSDEGSALLPEGSERPMVKRVTASGSGCPDSSAVTASFSEDGGWLVLQFGQGQLTAAVGPGVPQAAVLSACDIQLRLSLPQGYRFAIDRVSYLGYANMDPGTIALHSTRYWFLGSRMSARTAILEGSGDGEPYLVGSNFGPGAVASFCGLDRPMNLGVTLGMSSLGVPSLRGLATLGGDYQAILYRLSWREC